MKALTYLSFFSLVAIASCEMTSKPDMILLSNPLIVGKSSPIQLEPDQTTIFISDYVLDRERIDSVVVSAGLEAALSETEIALLGNLTNPLGTITLFDNGIGESILLKRAAKQKIQLAYSDGAKDVRARGEFNAWNKNNTVFKNENGIYSTELILNPGSYQYLLVVDGVEMRDPANPDSVNNGQGSWNSIISIDRPSKDKLPLLTSSSVDKDQAVFSLSNPSSGIIAFWNNTLIPSEYLEYKTNELFLTIPEAAKRAEYSIVCIWAYNDVGASNEILLPISNGKIVTDPTALTRFDRESMIMYFLMVDRFNNGDQTNDKPLNIPEVHPKADFYGGDLAGIIAKIKDGYFDWLGTNTIWVSPITQNPEGPYGQYPEPKTKFSGYHGYWPISNIRVDYRFGTDGEFKQLVDLAHEGNQNVLLDYVANHVHEEHPIYQKNKDWATPLYLPDGTENTQKWDEHRLTTWFDTFMPTLDLARPEIVAPMTDSAMYWLEEYNIDGFRHDATKHIPLLFWRELTKKVKNHANGATIPFQIGETYGSRELINSYINTGMLDSQFDFNMYDAAVAAFAQPNISFKTLASAITESAAYYGDHHLMGNITGNQDRARLISYADGSLRFDEDAKHAGWNREIVMNDTAAYRKLSALTAFMMTIPGIPCIYYGDEYGSIGGGDPDNRKMMKFDNLSAEELATRDRAKKMIELRKNNLALIYGDLTIERADAEVLIIRRKYFDNEVVSVFNKSTSKQTIDLGKKGGTTNFYGKMTDSSLSLPANSFEMVIY
jgi:cyclomaltodextrinase